MPAIEFTCNNQVGYITLNRPEKLNSFNREMAVMLQERLSECARDKNVRAVVLTGAGKAFSAGQDLAEVLDPHGPGMSRILLEHFNPIVTRIRQLNKPVIAAVNGVAAGAGANIALCCDIVVAAASSSFIQAFSKIGLIPDSGGTYFLPRLIGFQKASAYMMLGDRISAQEAEKSGMIYRCFADDQFVSEVDRIALQVANLPTKALAYTKQALNASLSNDLATQLTTEDELQQRAAATADFKEGVQAFIGKRNPSFKGE